MKNVNLSLKMVICLSTLFFLALAVGATGYISLDSLEKVTEAMYYEVVQATESIGYLRENFQEQRVYAQQLALMNDNPLVAESIRGFIEENKKEARGYLEFLKVEIVENADVLNKEILAADNQAAFYRVEDIYYNFFEPNLTALVGRMGTVDQEKALAFATAPEINEMSKLLAVAYDFYVGLSKNNLEDAKGVISRTHVIVAIVLLVSLLISAFFVCYLPITVARPMRRLVKVANSVAEGDMDVKVEDDNRRDEVGKLARAFERMQEAIVKQIEVLEGLAAGDLTVEPELRSENDTMGKALNSLSQNLDSMIANVAVSSDNVARESRQVASQSQELAQGTTEQAASVEELSSAFFEISLNTKESAESAQRAAELTENVRKMAVEGTKLMANMIQAVEEADAASKRVDKIIKVIEEISFQTNILALNAAVEAAHAGQNGSGFAVVAGEVRSLASKSAESSKETGELIANALEKVQLGADIANKTASSFEKIVEGVIESTKLIADMAKSSEEQAIAIGQINTGISQVAQVIHMNSSAAEKCATAAEKMSEQARELEETVGTFKRKHMGETLPLAVESEGVEAKPAPEKEIVLDLLPNIPNEDFGKY